MPCKLLASLSISITMTGWDSGLATKHQLSIQISNVKSNHISDTLQYGM